MNKVEQTLKEQGRSKTWMAGRLNMSRQLMDYKIDTDTFTNEQEWRIALELHTAHEILFPDAAPIEAQS